MGRRRSRTLTEVELQFMQVIWDAEDASAEEVRDALAKQKYRLTNGSVRKILSILLTKGYLTRRKFSHRYLYQAQVSRERANRSLLEDLYDRAFGGSATYMVAALLDSRMVKDGDLKKIKKLIAEKEREARSQG